MRLTQRAVIVVSLAFAGLVPATATMAATAPAGAGLAYVGNHCLQVTATIPVGTAPFGVAVNPKTGTIYLANTGDDTVSVINGRTSTVAATVPDGGAPADIAVNLKAKTIYVTNEDGNNVSVLAPCPK